MKRGPPEVFYAECGDVVAPAVASRYNAQIEGLMTVQARNQPKGQVMTFFEKYPPSLCLFACVALVMTLQLNVACGAGVALTWWAGHKLDTWGLRSG